MKKSASKQKCIGKTSLANLPVSRLLQRYAVVFDEDGTATRRSRTVRWHGAGSGVKLQRERGSVRHVRLVPENGGKHGRRRQRYDQFEFRAKRRGRMYGVGKPTEISLKRVLTIK